MKKFCLQELVYFYYSRLGKDNVYFFGIAGKIDENDIDIGVLLKKVKSLFLKDIFGIRASKKSV